MEHPIARPRKRRQASEHIAPNVRRRKNESKTAVSVARAIVRPALTTRPLVPRLATPTAPSAEVLFMDKKPAKLEGQPVRLEPPPVQRSVAPRGVGTIVTKLPNNGAKKKGNNRGAQLPRRVSRNVAGVKPSVSPFSAASRTNEQIALGISAPANVVRNADTNKVGTHNRASWDPGASRPAWTNAGMPNVSNANVPNRDRHASPAFSVGSSPKKKKKRGKKKPASGDATPALPATNRTNANAVAKVGVKQPEGQKKKNKKKKSKNKNKKNKAGASNTSQGTAGTAQTPKRKMTQSSAQRYPASSGPGSMRRVFVQQEAPHGNWTDGFHSRPSRISHDKSCAPRSGSSRRPSRFAPAPPSALAAKKRTKGAAEAIPSITLSSDAAVKTPWSNSCIGQDPMAPPPVQPVACARRISPTPLLTLLKDHNVPRKKPITPPQTRDTAPVTASLPTTQRSVPGGKATARRLPSPPHERIAVPVAARHRSSSLLSEKAAARRLPSAVRQAPPVAERRSTAPMLPKSPKFAAVGKDTAPKLPSTRERNEKLKDARHRSSLPQYTTWKSIPPGKATAHRVQSLPHATNVVTPVTGQQRLASLPPVRQKEMLVSLPKPTARRQPRSHNDAPAARLRSLSPVPADALAAAAAAVAAGRDASPTPSPPRNSSVATQRRSAAFGMGFGSSITTAETAVGLRRSSWSSVPDDALAAAAAAVAAGRDASPSRPCISEADLRSPPIPADARAAAAAAVAIGRYASPTPPGGSSPKVVIRNRLPSPVPPDALAAAIDAVAAGRDASPTPTPPPSGTHCSLSSVPADALAAAVAAVASGRSVYSTPALLRVTERKVKSEVDTRPRKIPADALSDARAAVAAWR